MSSIKTSLVFLAITAALTISGCGDKNSQAIFSAESGHPSGWKTGHNTFAKSNIESCFECHGEELDGGIAKVSCTQCHLGSNEAIHPLQWGSYAYARHAAYVETNGTSTCANASCHGTNLAGNGDIPSCTACHIKKGDTYSKHPATWAVGTGHAAYLEQNPATATKAVPKGVQTVTGGNTVYPSCSTPKCHGTDLKGVFLSGPSCYTCHTVTTQSGAFSKHPVSWSSAVSSHGSYVVANGNTSCGTSVCHGTDFKGVTDSGPSCSKCHPAGPSSKHPVAWGGYAKQGVPSHGAYVKAKTNTSCATSLCHGTDSKGVSGGGTSCYSCHTDGPTSEHPVAWTTSPLRNHGSYAKASGYTSCATAVCHGTDAKGVNGSGTSCYSCHTAGPTSKHPTTWTNSAVLNHSSYVKANGYTSCATIYCHGTNAQGGTGGSLAPSCYSCHPAGPTSKHPTEWTSARQNHTAFVSSHTTYSCKNSTCHASKANLRFTDPAKPECSACHAN